MRGNGKDNREFHHFRNNKKNSFHPPKRNDGRYWVWCRHFVPKQAHQKTVFCQSRDCDKQLPYRMNISGYNVPWTRCPECDSFIRKYFNFCQLCSEPMEAGKRIIQQRKTAQQKAAFKNRYEKLQEQIEEKLIASLPANLWTSKQISGSPLTCGSKEKVPGIQISKISCRPSTSGSNEKVIDGSKGFERSTAQKEEDRSATPLKLQNNSENEVMDEESK